MSTDDLDTCNSPHPDSPAASTVSPGSTFTFALNIDTVTAAVWQGKDDDRHPDIPVPVWNSLVGAIGTNRALGTSGAKMETEHEGLVWKADATRRYDGSGGTAVYDVLLVADYTADAADLAHGREIDNARDRVHADISDLRRALDAARRSAAHLASEQVFDVEMEGSATRLLTAALDQIEVGIAAARQVVPKADTATHYVLAGGKARCGATGDYLRYSNTPTCKDCR